jgi:hypothetical protein
MKFCAMPELCNAADEIPLCISVHLLWKGLVAVPVVAG